VEDEMTARSYEIGLVGLGVMGHNLFLNMADHGYSLAGYDKDATKVAGLRQEAEKREHPRRGASSSPSGGSCGPGKQAMTRKS
jgi:3-hydroxyisobutyrate dehydrogenase-like beta-hydroxyacid dehydrogenase